MAKQTLFWTALPNGFTEDGQSLRVSLLVSPRLVPDNNPGELREFLDFVDWPATLRETRFTLTFGAQSVDVAGNDFTRIDDRLGRADSAVWTALFPDTTPVVGFEWRDLTNHSVLSFPAADVDQLVQNLYTDLAASAGEQLPKPSTFLTNPQWTKLVDAVQNVDRFTHERTGLRRINDQFAAFKNHGFDPPREGPSDTVDAISRNLARFQLFHTPPSKPKTEKYQGKTKPDAKAYAEWQGFERTKLPAPEDFKDIYDFHKIVSAMNQYPTLLRKLGLVIDFLIPRDAFTASTDALLSATVTLPAGQPFQVFERQPDSSPLTHALLDQSRFQAVPRKPAADLHIVDGLLDLNPRTFNLLQADVDGSAMKVINFARSLLQLRDAPAQQADPVTRHERELGAPALRNAGLILVQRKRADTLTTAVKTQDGFNKNANANPPVRSEMIAEDLVRGYRIDIWDDVSRRWHSLCGRSATYNIATGAAVVNVAGEEGTVRLAATTSPDKTNNADIIWLHEALVTWAGWGLCVPPPGKTIHHRATKVENGKEVVVHEDPVGDPEAKVPPGLRLQTAFKILPGTLPRLRYGRRYRIRARVVDLAGNSLEFQPKDFGPEQSRDDATRYLRYEPISAPAIALLKPHPGSTYRPEEGESMERVAIRSFNDTPPMNSLSATQRAYRIAVPPRTTQREAEQHGMLDRAGIVDPSFFAMLAAKDNSLAEEKIKTAGPLAGDPVETGYAVMVDGDDVPYLPDPLAIRIGARFFNHPTFSSEHIIPIPFYAGTDWPDALPFKVEIYENPADIPHFDGALRTLFVPLPKAARVILRLSVMPGGDALDVMGVWNWLTPAQRARDVSFSGQPVSLERLVHSGQHWMITPWRNVELVHAVQRPLITPEFKSLQITRFPQDTFATPRFISTCSIPSTDRLDLRAAWNEPRDDVSNDKLEDVPRLDTAFSVKITDDQSYGDMHEYTPQGSNAVEVNGDFHEQRGRKKVHEFHDTRYRRIKYWLEGTTKFREFLPAGLLTEAVNDETTPTEEHIKVTGPEEIRWINSTAPPPPPEILYVVPTFGWVRSEDETGKRSWRRGGGLRIYLNRPWNVTGYGEMLAVVLPPSNFDGDPDREPPKPPYKKFITQWGNDPIWLSPFVPGLAPKLSNFPLARTAPDPDGKWLPSFAPADEADQPHGPFRTTGLVPPEFPNGPLFLDIAPHDVFYDDERKLCYCDIEVTWGASYFPFIRLALARYQPASADTAHLSSIVFADFMPLIPDRWLNVTHTNDVRTRQVRVFGNTYFDSSSHREADATRNSVSVAASSVVEVWVEKFDPERGEDFGWSRVSHARIQREGAAPPRPPLQTFRLRANELVRQHEFAALLDENLIDRVSLFPMLWQGQVTLPEDPGRGTRYRLVIAEFEEYLVDDSTPYDPPVNGKGRRLVFIEHVTLD